MQAIFRSERGSAVGLDCRAGSVRGTAAHDWHLKFADCTPATECPRANSGTSVAGPDKGTVHLSYSGRSRWQVLSGWPFAKGWKLRLDPQREFRTDLCWAGFFVAASRP